MDTVSASATDRPALFSRFLLSLAGLALACFGLHTVANSSVWMHLASGRFIAQNGLPTQDPFSFTTDPGRPWVNPSWLYDVGLYRAWEWIGPSGLIVLHALLGLAAFLLALQAVRATPHPLTKAATLLAVGPAIAPLFYIGPALPALALAGLFMAILERRGSPLMAWIILLPAQLLWTNLHGSFLIGPLLALAYAGQAYLLQKRGSDSTSRPGILGLLGLALLAVTLVNPYGPGLHRMALSTITNPSMGVIIEWISPYQAEFAALRLPGAGTLLLVLVACGFIFVRDRLPPALTVCAVIGAFLLVVSPRFALFSALLVTPFTAISLEGLARLIRQQPGLAGRPLQVMWKASHAVLLVVAVGSLFYVTSNRYFVRTGSAASFGLGVASGLWPEVACEKVISRPDFPQRAINLAMDGGFIAWKTPSRRVFVDPRVTVYGAAYYQGLARALLGQAEAWTNLMTRWDPGAIILNCSWPGAGATVRRLVDEKSQWALVYFDGVSAILARRTTENKALISDLALQSAGLAALESQRRLVHVQKRSLRVPGNPSQLMGAGAVYLALGRFREAASVYEDIVRLSPAYVTGWLNLGISMLQKSHFDEALRALEKARDVRKESALAWLWLSKAYEAKQQTRESERAMQKARELNKSMADAFQQGLQSVTNRPMPGTLNATNR